MNRREFLHLAGAVPVFAAAPGALAIQEGPSSFVPVTEAQTQAIEKGLRYLAKNQSRSGALGTSAQVAFTGLGGLAWLADGSTPRRGPYARNIRKALHFLIRNTSRRGYINEGSGRGFGGSGMHGHGFAALFLAELYGMIGDTEDHNDGEVRDALQKAVKLIESSQDRNGGWTYNPSPNGHEGSVTITQVHALRAARNVGITVDKGVIEKGIGYIKKTTNSDGTVAYGLGMRGGRGSYALTAAGACVYNNYGLHDSPELKRCMKALNRFLKGSQFRSGHQYYAHFYAAQAMYFARRYDRAAYEKGYSAIRKDLLRLQNKSSGGWPNDGYGGAYGTACAVLALQVPLKMLSIFEA